MHLPSDIVHHIIDVLTLTYIGSDESSSFSTSALCAASWISKDFASITRKHLFRDISINSEARCCSLLALLEKNPVLQTFITHVVLKPSSYLECPLPNSLTDPGISWIVSPMALELMNKLHRLSSITFLVITLDGQMVDCIITRTLRLRQHDITRLNLDSCDSMSLHELDKLIMYLPALETISLSHYTSCVIHSREGDRDHTTIRDTRQHPLRRMKLLLQDDETMAELPTWFTSRTYLSSIKELDLACQTSTLSASAWDIIIAASSSLTHLTLHTPRVHNVMAPYNRFETLAAPALTSLRLTGDRTTMEWIITIISSIAPCTAMRKLEVDNVKHRSSDRYDLTIALWGRIDDILTRTFPHLQCAHIEIEWEIYPGDRLPEEKAIRLAMPGLDRMGILELAFSVTIDDEDSDSYYGFGLFD
jgi:hypothetical protein